MLRYCLDFFIPSAIAIVLLNNNAWMQKLTFTQGNILESYFRLRLPKMKRLHTSLFSNINNFNNSRGRKLSNTIMCITKTMAGSLQYSSTNLRDLTPVPEWDLNFGNCWLRSHIHNFRNSLCKTIKDQKTNFPYHFNLCLIHYRSLITCNLPNYFIFKYSNARHIWS